MGTLLIALFILIAGLVVLALWVIAIYNDLVRKKQMVEEAWSGIDVQLKRRHDLIPNLVETVKGYAKHERETLENVTRARARAMDASTPEERMKAEQDLSRALLNLFAVAEAYPDLKANENFLHLQEELSAIEDEIQLARRYYNATVREYNIAIQTFPRNIVASIFGFREYQYFEMEPEEKEPPQVKF